MFLQNGFDDFLSKPIDTAILNAMLIKWLPKHKQLKPSESPDAGENKPWVGLEIAGVDVNRGIELTGGTAQGYLNALKYFYSDCIEKINEIKSSLEKENLSSYTVCVHALKSIAASIGAEEMSLAAKGLETASRHGNVSFIQVHNANFLSNLEILLENIYPVISAAENKNLNGPPIDMELVKATLARLKAAIIAHDTASVNEIAKDLEKYAQTTNGSDSINRILQNKLTGDYDETIRLIDTLL
jgi:HPt (histidine-containing phosphotransfer) domain-containing protein